MFKGGRFGARFFSGLIRKTLLIYANLTDTDPNACPPLTSIANHYHNPSRSVNAQRLLTDSDSDILGTFPVSQ